MACICLGEILKWTLLFLLFIGLCAGLLYVLYFIGSWLLGILYLVITSIPNLILILAKKLGELIGWILYYFVYALVYVIYCIISLPFYILKGVLSGLFGIF